MGLRPDEISALIKEQIKHFDDVIELKDVGTVMTVGDGVSLIHGLDNAMKIASEPYYLDLKVRLKKETKLNVLERLWKYQLGMRC